MTEKSAEQTGSKTPRTDAVIHNGSCSDAVNKYRELSRQLEISLDESQKECERLKKEREIFRSCYATEVRKSQEYLKRAEAEKSRADNAERERK